MISLFIDTSTSKLIIGIYKDKKELILKNIEAHNDLSSKVLSCLKNTLDELNLNIQDINEIYCVTGPGSFTGIRVGVTICKTLALCLNIKVYAVSSLLLMASGSNGYSVPLIDARRGYVYAGLYDNNLNNIIQDQYIKLDDLKELIKKYKNINYISYDEIDQSIKPDLNIERLLNTCTFKEYTSHELNPNYLKKTEAEEKLNDK